MQRILKYTAIIMLFGIATVAFGAEAEGEDEELALPEDKGIVKAVIHGDMNCSLKRLPEVRQFIEEDLPYFHNTEYQHGKHELTELFLLNKNDEVVEFYPLADYDREGCNNLLLKKGFYKKSRIDEEVPTEYKNGPYKERDEL